MTKKEFLALLKNALYGLPEEDIRESLVFYNEMIADRMEEGLTEEAAVADIGSISEIAAQIKAEKSPVASTDTKPTKSHTIARKLSATEITLIVLGSPIWLSLIAAAFAVVISVFAAALSVGISLIAAAFILAIMFIVVIWMLGITLCAIDLSLIAASVGGVMTFVYAIKGSFVYGTFILGAALVCAGLSVFAIALTKKMLPALVVFTKKFTLESLKVIKNSFDLTYSSIKNTTIAIARRIGKGTKK